LANVDEEALIEKIILDKKSWLTGLEPNKAKEKLIAYLSRRGFSWEKIRLGLEKSDLFD
jgi:SOS response regulatory protein OraA/RecX